VKVRKYSGEQSRTIKKFKRDRKSQTTNYCAKLCVIKKHLKKPFAIIKPFKIKWKKSMAFMNQEFFL